MFKLEFLITTRYTYDFNCVLFYLIEIVVLIFHFEVFCTHEQMCFVSLLLFTFEIYIAAIQVFFTDEMFVILLMNALGLFCIIRG